VAGTVRDKSDQFPRITPKVRPNFVNEITGQLYNVSIGPFVMAANVMGLSSLTAKQNLPKRLGVVSHEKPVAHVHPIAIDRERSAIDQILNYYRNKFFRKLIRTVVVRTIRDHCVEAVGMMIGTNKHITRRFAGGVRRVRRVRGTFREITT